MKVLGENTQTFKGFRTNYEKLGPLGKFFFSFKYYVYNVRVFLFCEPFKLFLHLQFFYPKRHTNFAYKKFPQTENYTKRARDL